MDNDAITDYVEKRADLIEARQERKAMERHQPPANPPVREFADHMDAARQGMKDWVRKEIGLLTLDKSHDERVAENP